MVVAVAGEEWLSLWLGELSAHFCDLRLQPCTLWGKASAANETTATNPTSSPASSTQPQYSCTELETAPAFADQKI